MSAIVLIQVGDNVVVARGQCAGATRACTRTGSGNTRGCWGNSRCTTWLRKYSSTKDGECYVSKRRALTTKGPLSILGDGEGTLKGKEKRGGRCSSHRGTTQLGCTREE